jgi:ABC-2 type transport system permease protein
MTLAALAAMVRKDLLLFFADRRALVMAFAAPIAIASFFGSLFPGPDASREPARVAIHLVDQDGSAVAMSILAGVRADRNLAVTVGSVAEARAAVRRSRSSVAVVVPEGFGAAASLALVAGGRTPQLEMLYDPSRGAELALVRGLLIEHVMRAVSPPGFGVPYGVRAEALTAGAGARYNGYAHAFAGMGVQFLLFAAIDLGVGVLLERQRGLWKRLRSAPISRLTLLGGKTASGTVITLLPLLVSFGFAMLVFGVRIEGSVAGFAAVAVACALMASTFGLFLAAVGRTPGTTRGVAILAVLLMVMLGGAWVPTFVFPAWLQSLTIVVPARWAVDGLDAMTWRGLGFGAALTPAAVLLGFAALFGTLAVARFRREESPSTTTPGGRP